MGVSFIENAFVRVVVERIILICADTAATLMVCRCRSMAIRPVSLRGRLLARLF